MHATLTDLFAHMAWADAEHWRSISGHPGALDDPELQERLRHIALVQSAFLDVLHGQVPRLPRPGEEPPLQELLRAVRRSHDEAAAFLAEVGPRLEEPVQVPWFKDPACHLPVREALLQVAMHSHGHRAQNAARLRALGGEAPTTDFIVWVWKGRPAPAWP